MKLAAIAVVLLGCAREPAPSATPPPSAPVVKVAVVDPALAGARERGHEALSRDCGECHESHRPTAKLPALAVFDLDKPDWLTRFDERRFTVALQRLLGDGLRLANFRRGDVRNHSGRGDAFPLA